jgi:NAD(P)-dependent dehydrogenase (short-subunit alcohol dehydrogenase family)
MTGFDHHVAARPGGLDGRIVLVTGAAGTIGRAITAAIEEQGGIAVRTDRPGTAGIEVALDVTQEQDWTAAMSAVADRHGRLDGLVNNAGVIHVGDVEATSLADWRRVMAVNVDGVFLGCKHGMNLLARGREPSIVNVSSVSGIVGGANLAAYNASKGAVRLLTKSVALSGARRSPQVRCNSLHPAFVEGDMVDAMAASARDPERARARMAAEVPLGRMARPDEIAAAVVWLLSPASSFVTGTELVIDGGLVAR